MAVEAKFRNGENPGRPWGGNVADHPFTQALYELAQSRGYPSQLGLAETVGVIRNSTLGYWYRGEKIPTRRKLDLVLGFLKPSDEERDQLIASYELLRTQRREQKV
jgi:hypothetical protein